MNTKEKQALASQLGKQIIALQQIKDALEKPDASRTSSDKPPTQKPRGKTGADLIRKMQEDEARKKPKHW